MWKRIDQRNTRDEASRLKSHTLALTASKYRPQPWFSYAFPGEEWSYKAWGNLPTHSNKRERMRTPKLFIIGAVVVVVVVAADKLVVRDLDYGLLDPKKDFCVQGFHQSLSPTLPVSPAAIEAGKLVLMVVMFVVGAVLDDTLYIVGGFVIYNYNNTQYAEPSETSSLYITASPLPPPTLPSTTPTEYILTSPTIHRHLPTHPQPQWPLHAQRPQQHALHLHA